MQLFSDNCYLNLLAIKKIAYAFQWTKQLEKRSVGVGGNRENHLLMLRNVNIAVSFNNTVWWKLAIITLKSVADAYMNKKDCVNIEIWTFDEYCILVLMIILALALKFYSFNFKYIVCWLQALEREPFLSYCHRTAFPLEIRCLCTFSCWVSFV